MLRADTVTLSDWIRGAEATLRDAGCASPRYDAERLAAHGLGVAWGDIWTKLREPIDPHLDDLLERRRSGEPLAYIVGTAVFYGIELECGPGVLVPRPETETLVDVALELIADRDAPMVVDMGTGTGAIAIAIACQRPDADVWATDIDRDAMRYAEVNIRRNGVRVEMLQGDLFAALPDRLRGRLDLVVSNPPYVPCDAQVGRDVWAEPREAVFAGAVGDEALRRLASDAGEWIAPGGAIAMEIGTRDQIASVMNALRGFGGVRRRLDHTGRSRVVWATRN